MTVPTPHDESWAQPTISVLIPTLNAGRYLDGCLSSLRQQAYPQDRIEIILADGGSTDDTLAIARSHRVDRVIPNPRVTAEAARATLLPEANGEFVLSLDSDNYLVGRDWLTRMVAALDDPSVFGAEPIRWHYRREDPPLNRYFCLTGVNDPVSLFLGNYGHYSYVTDRWTECPHDEERRDGYIVATLRPREVPTLGANGFLVRTSVLRSLGMLEYYFDIDVVARLVEMGHRRVARVDLDVGHHFARDLPALRRKVGRRIADYLYWRNERRYPWLSMRRGRLYAFVLSTITVLPIVVQATRGYARRPDAAWLYHIPVCWLTLLIYTWHLAHPRRRPFSRKGWMH